MNNLPIIFRILRSAKFNTIGVQYLTLITLYDIFTAERLVENIAERLVSMPRVREA